LLVADQYVAQKGGSADSVRLAKRQLYENVFAENKISPRQYQMSLKYYMNDPTRFKMMYDTLSEKANRERFQPKPLQAKN
jgi:Domain of unknown function (DUF4296)